MTFHFNHATLHQRIYTLTAAALLLALTGGATPARAMPGTGEQPGQGGDIARVYLPLVTNGISTDTVKPNAPTGLDAPPATVLPNSVTLIWNTASDNAGGSGLLGYAVYRDGMIIANIGLVTNYVDATVSPSTSYSYFVKSRDAAGNSSTQSNGVNPITPAPLDMAPPSTPGGLQAVATGPTLVTLTWNPATDDVGIAGYDIWRDGVFLISVDTITGTTDSTVLPATQYSYQVRARDTAPTPNLSAPSAAVMVTTPLAADSTAPSTPTGLMTTTITATLVTLTWNASTDNIGGSGLAGYDLIRNGVSVSSTVGALTSYTDSPISQTTAYTYQVKARDVAGNLSPASVALLLTTPTSTDTVSPSVPTGVTAIALGSQTQVTISWNAATDNVAVTAYDVYRNGVFLLSTGPVTSIGDFAVSSGTTYTYTVRARDASGNISGFSAPAVVTTPGPIFSDGFETGNFTNWTTFRGLVVENSVVHSGTKAAQGNAVAGNFYAKKTMPQNATFTNAYARMYFNVITNTDQITLLRFRTAADGSIGYLFISVSGKLWWRNDVTGIQTSSITPALVGTGWHRLELHMTLTGGAFSTTEVWLDGVVVGMLSTTANMGATPIAKLQIGDVQSGTDNVVFDDAAFDTRRIGP